MDCGGAAAFPDETNRTEADSAQVENLGGSLLKRLRLGMYPLNRSVEVRICAEDHQVDPRTNAEPAC